MAKNEKQNEFNLLLAVALMVFSSAVASLFSAYICEFVLDSFDDSSAMALLITDAGVKSDDKHLEKNLTSATIALKSCRDLGVVLGIGSLGVGLAVGIRIKKSKDTPKA